jgi:hypothetical protein
MSNYLSSRTYYKRSGKGRFKPVLSKRFFVTVPDVIGDALDRWAEAERNKPTTLAAFLLEQVVRQAMDEGKIPLSKEAEAATFSYKSISQLVMRNWEQLVEYGRVEAERLKAIRDDGDCPNELEIARIALALNLEESYVESLAKKGKQPNGTR